MTPQEKAKQIVDRFRTNVVMWAGDNPTQKENLKQCAYIVVDEIINLTTSKNFAYWQEVNEEIEKL
jgi:hypothetical protein